MHFESRPASVARFWQAFSKFKSFGWTAKNFLI
jgi:hypothetical protein